MPHFNPLVSRLSPPAVPAVQAWARAYRGDLGPLIDMSQAVPGYPPHPDLLRWLADAAGSRDYAGYGEIEGEPSLRAAYAAHVSELYHADIGAESIHITSGCNQAFVAAVMAVAGSGEAVMVVNPVYFNHEATLRMLGVRVAAVDAAASAGFLPSIRAVEAALSPDVRAIALVSPNNPTGAVYPPELLDAVFDLCRHTGRWLILDETYRDFLPEAGQPPHRLFGKPNWRETLIQLYSFSKSFCIPGHRLGAIAAGGELVTQVAKIMDNLQICAPRPAQAALTRAIPALKDWREGNRRAIQPRGKALRETLAGCQGWEIDALGAYFAYVRHPFDGESSPKVAEGLARAAGVVTIPGGFFGSGQEGHLRFAFANADVETIGGLGQRLKRFAAL